MISSQKENNNKKLDKKNLVVKTIKSQNGSFEKIISRKKRIELSKSVNKNLQFNKQHTVLYFD